MMPIALARRDEDLVVRKVGGGKDSAARIKALGITEGSSIRVISEVAGNLIVQVKESRLAISSDLSKKIYV